MFYSAAAYKARECSKIQTRAIRPRLPHWFSSRPVPLAEVQSRFGGILMKGAARMNYPPTSETARNRLLGTTPDCQSVSFNFGVSEFRRPPQHWSETNDGRQYMPILLRRGGYSEPIDTNADRRNRDCRRSIAERNLLDRHFRWLTDMVGGIRTTPRHLP